MRHVDVSSLEIDRFDSTLLRAALGRHGWHLQGGQRGLYDRWVNDLEPQRKLLVPLDPSRPDYRELLEDAVHALAASNLAEAGRVLQHLAVAPGDEIRFCKDVQTVGGAVAWNVGEELYSSASDALKASAKATVAKRPNFGNSNAFVAKDFMNAVLMGQTEVGSYVVTAYTPPERPIYERESYRRDAIFERSGIYSGREVVQVMGDVLAVTREALDENARTERLEQFDEAVQYGFSREMAGALKGLVHQSDGAAVTIDWSHVASLAGDISLPVPRKSLERREVEFKPRDYSVLKEVEKRLSKPTDVEQVQVTGTVEVLTRQVGKPGVIVLNVRSGSPAKKIRVQLPPSTYNRALEAHRREWAVRLNGRQERRGNYYWIFDASGLLVLAPEKRTTQSMQTSLQIVDESED